MDTTPIYNSNRQSAMSMAAIISSQLGKRDIRATILLAVVAVHGPLLLVLSSRQRRSGNPVGRYLLWGLSAAYSPLMTSVLSYLTTYIPSSGGKATAVLVLVILVQFLRAKFDMAAMAVAAVASPAAGDDGVNSLKIRPSTDSFINTFWVATLVIYNIFSTILKEQSTAKHKGHLLLVVTLLMSPLWALGACRMVLRFMAFQKATDSVALGRNVELIDDYMLQVREQLEREMAAAQPQQLPVVPRLIVTGERKRDVEERPQGYHVKQPSTSLQSGEGSSRLVTLDRVWSSDYEEFLRPEDKDLCLSFALFKCLRRRFAGYRLAAEAGSSWAFRFVCDGMLLGRGENEDDDKLHKRKRVFRVERVFRVIGTELSFASDFFYSALPIASLGTTAAGIHFLLSLIIFPSFLLLLLALLFYPKVVHSSSYLYYRNPLVLLEIVLTLVNAGLEIKEMVDSVRSNWTKISIIGHIIRCRHPCARRFLAWLLGRCKAPEFWHDKIRQTQMLKPDLLIVQQPCACSCRFTARPKQLLSLIRGRNDDDKIKVPVEVKEAILESLRRSGGQLSDWTAAIRRRPSTRGNDITWACRERDGSGVLTTTDAILVWHIATTLFDMKCRRSDLAGSTPSPSTMPRANDDRKSKVVVACHLSCYCMYLVAEAPELLLDKPAWIKRRYKAVKKSIEEAPKCNGDELSLYQHLLDTFSENSHEVLISGVKLATQLEEEDEDKVWVLLSDFWSEMLLYLAPSDNVKVHIEALQWGGELITLLWVLLLHAGITSRPVEYNFTP